MVDRGKPALEVTGLSKTYGKGRAPFHAVKGISFTVRSGEVYGFLGPNGAGKSTTIRMLLGLISPTAGEIRLFGRDPKRDASVLRRVGALVDGGNFYPFLSGRKNLQVLARTHGNGEERIDALLEQVGLHAAGRRKISAYSTGMRQRLGVAAALLNDPEIVILDEPVNGLDVSGIQEMRELIQRLAAEDGKTVFLSSHLLHEVEQVCDRVAIITRGALVRESSISDLIRLDNGLLIGATPLQAALTALCQRWVVKVDGDLLHVNASAAETPEIVRLLVETEVDVLSVTPAQRRTLEEVFLAITGQEDADA